MSERLIWFFILCTLCILGLFLYAQWKDKGVVKTRNQQKAIKHLFDGKMVVVVGNNATYTIKCVYEKSRPYWWIREDDLRMTTPRAALIYVENRLHEVSIYKLIQEGK